MYKRLQLRLHFSLRSSTLLSSHYPVDAPLHPEFFVLFKLVSQSQKRGNGISCTGCAESCRFASLCADIGLEGETVHNGCRPISFVPVCWATCPVAHICWCMVPLPRCLLVCVERGREGSWLEWNVQGPCGAPVHAGVMDTLSGNHYRSP